MDWNALADRALDGQRATADEALAMLASGVDERCRAARCS
jgi:hypothetical protein